jgi:diaminohydroxyphosphoribosylaminopyrimidine deaminase/5-amino-6-(5-phosphoribosylamino)uracil reductase
MVGAVIVYGNNIVGEGYTSRYGGPHAEVNAINAVKDKSYLSKSTLYVTLEPCSHYGKTPPCADLIVKHKIPHVVIGTLDPHEKVMGKGVARLKDSGCEVTVGILEEACKEHHRRFLTFHQKKRPYLILKWAETMDGFIAPLHDKREVKPQPYWISNSYSRQLVHKWRSQEQAILVGTKTVLADNPKLNVRTWFGRTPIRVIIDRKLRVNSDYHVLDQNAKTIIITEIKKGPKWVKNIDYEVVDFTKNVPQQICQLLYKHNTTSVLIEGGGKTLESFISDNLWDEARIFVGPNSFGEGIKAPHFSGTKKSTRKIGSDILNLYKND